MRGMEPRKSIRGAVPEHDSGRETNSTGTLGKAFGALGDVGKQIVPQAQKLVRQVDDLTGGVIGSGYKDIFAFVVLIVVLIIRPHGLLGRKTAEKV